MTACSTRLKTMMSNSSSWTNQQATTAKTLKKATSAPTKLNALEINAMTAKCKHCNDTKIEPGEGPCIWCKQVGPATTGTVERFTIATLRYAGGAEHDVRYVSEAHYDAALAETKCLKAVLNGMEFKQVDDMVSDGVDACLFLGQESARIIKGIQAERDALLGELARYKSLFGQAQKAIDRLNELHPKRMGELAKRLSVAEQLLREAQAAFNYDPEGSCYNPGISFVKPWSIKVIAALNPAAEAPGSTCNQILEESGLPTKNPCVACNNGACIDR